MREAVAYKAGILLTLSPSFFILTITLNIIVYYKKITFSTQTKKSQSDNA